MTYNFEYMTIYLLIDTLWNLRLMKMILDLSSRVENQVILNFLSLLIFLLIQLMIQLQLYNYFQTLFLDFYNNRYWLQ